MIGLLNAYRLEQDAPAYQLEYGAIFSDFLGRAFPGESVRVFNVALGELPGSARDCDAWIISGSPKGAYDPDPWIAKLGGFIQAAHQDKAKLIGVCFGHQLVAEALGGKAEKSTKGWGVGVRKFRIVEESPWMQPKLGEVSLLFSHQDQVTTLPPGARLLGTDDFCPHQMYRIGKHIFCLQGHPEYTPDFMKGRLDSRIDRIGKSVYDVAVQSLAQKTNAPEIGEWMRRFLGDS